MAATIKLSELVRKIENRDLGKADIASYFEVDAENSHSSAPRFRIRADRVDLTGLEAAAYAAGHELALAAERGNRAQRQGQVLSTFAAAGAVILAEGDSWFSFPFSKTAVDVLQDWGYAIENIATAGDELVDILRRREYIPHLRSGRITHFLFSGGGNDVLGDITALVRMYNPQYIDANNPAHVDYYVMPEFTTIVLPSLRANYLTLLNDVRAVSPATRTILHGYAYCPVAYEGIYLGRRFQQLGFEVGHVPAHKRMADAIVRRMVDRFNLLLQGLATGSSTVIYCDLRQTVSQTNPSDWFDAELHASKRGAKKIARALVEHLPGVIQVEAA
jgi:hypothetical protein